ncbi:hypothetical protein V0288_12815 [Pannus brasiliensis CCIBt3594]|uniref:Uncharacterized protein n=1 Tax=Pannus brasiliensis CCIBt3594 TaxID=1427578 RepID=A0AAW9QWE7_9CHRO
MPIALIAGFLTAEPAFLAGVGDPGAIAPAPPKSLAPEIRASVAIRSGGVARRLRSQELGVGIQDNTL